MAAFVTRLRPDGYPTKSLVTYQINQQFFRQNLPPLVLRPFDHFADELVT